jgi:hypothetical protein
MSLTYGYDLKDGDKILEAPVQVSKIMVRLGLPGAALINQPPICALSNCFPVIPVVPHNYFQCDTFLHGSRTSATNHWRK